MKKNAIFIKAKKFTSLDEKNAIFIKAKKITSLDEKMPFYKSKKKFILQSSPFFSSKYETKLPPKRDYFQG
jgi:hypothetical protein